VDCVIQECENGSGWFDPFTALCWQVGLSTGINWYEASGTADASYNAGGVSHCEDSTYGGLTDWRLPDIDELISLMRGCKNGSNADLAAVSTCGVSDPSCLGDSCKDATACAICTSFGGPDSGGCYWNDALSGACNYTNSNCWSSSTSEALSGDAWQVNFLKGEVVHYAKFYDRYVRCVRGPLL
jgi:hypothetical protein